MPSSRTKTLIFSGFTSLILLMLAVVGVLIDRLAVTTQELRESVRVYDLKTSLLAEMYDIKQRRKLALVQMLTEADAFERDEHYQRFLLLGGRFISLRDRYLSFALTPREDEAWSAVASLVARSAAVSQALVVRARAGGDLLSVREVLSGNEATQASESAALKGLLNVVREQEQDVLRRADKKFFSSVVLALAMLGVAVGLGVMIARRVARNAEEITRGLQAQVFRAEAVSKELAWHASHDSLTKLVNRREFKRHLDRLCRQAKADKLSHGLLVLNLDQFKIVNESCGYAAGDTLLRQLAASMRRILPENNVLARLGGNEFGVIVPLANTRRALETAETLRALIQEFRFAWRGRMFELAVSVGVTIVNRENSDPQEALTAADSACYRAKSEARNRIHMFSVRDRWWSREREQVNWTQQIPQAIRDKRLVLHAQEIRRVDGQSVGRKHFELLVRMRDDAGGLVTPAAFVPVAERFGLAPELDRAIIRQAFEWIGKLNTQLRAIHADLVNEELCSFSINLSGQSLSDNELLDEVLEQFETHGVQPRQICFEITETAVITNLQSAKDFIHRLKEVGCRFALDDFGSGVSSFGYLKGLDVDYIKIDGKIVRQMQNGHVECAIVEAIAHVAREMQVQTVAEFAENDWTMIELRRLGIDYAQGYGVHRPEPLENLSFEPNRQRPLQLETLP